MDASFIVEMSPTIAMIIIAIVVFICLNKLAKALTVRRFSVDEIKHIRADDAHIILSELSLLYRIRTGLSKELINVISGGEIDTRYPEKVNSFLQNLCDSLQRILKKVTGEDCSVSIKLFVPSKADQQRPMVKTMFRDSEFYRQRNDIYGDLEPFNIEDHTIMNDIMSSQPLKRFIQSNDLTTYKDYKNPNKEWKKIFNASAIHIISDPNSPSETLFLGFLCADAPYGRFDEETVKYIMNILSTKVYYCIYASGALDRLRENQEKSTVSISGDRK